MSTLDQYREAKTNYLKLKNQAKKELLARFNELAGELLQVQRELLEDFGEKVAMPSAKGKKPKAVKKAPSEAAAPAPTPAVVAAPSAKVVQLRKQIDKENKKLSDAKTQNKPTRAIEDRIYELEDALRLAEEK